MRGSNDREIALFLHWPASSMTISRGAVDFTVPRGPEPYQEAVSNISSVGHKGMQINVHRKDLTL